MQRGVSRGSGSGEEEDDAELASLMREGSRRAATLETNAAHAPPPPRARWRLFLGALVLLSQVLLEVARRALAWVERHGPRYVALLDRCLVHVLRVTVRPRKPVGMLRVLLALCMVLAVPYLVVTMRRLGFPTGSGLTLHAQELTEDMIRPHIIVERAGPPTATRRQALLREGGDGLQPDDTADSCENTVQGAHMITDSMGYVCSRTQLDRDKPGCCNETDASLPRIKQFTCDRCDTSAPHCCDVYEHCVSCCMHPLNTNTRREFLTHAEPAHPIYGDPSSLTVFQYCRARCRSSSASVQHQNSYRSRRMHCYGIHRPLKVLPTVNSDGLHDEWTDASLGGGDDQLAAATQLELDPFYRSD